MFERTGYGGVFCGVFGNGQRERETGGMSAVKSERWLIRAAYYLALVEKFSRDSARYVRVLCRAVLS